MDKFSTDNAFSKDDCEIVFLAIHLNMIDAIDVKFFNDVQAIDIKEFLSTKIQKEQMDFINSLRKKVHHLVEEEAVKECPLSKGCIVYKLNFAVAIANYCKKDYMKCVRYQLQKEYGDITIPPNMLPNDSVQQKVQHIQKHENSLFGTIAVRLNFVSEEDIKQVRIIQRLQRRHDKEQRMGDILEEQGLMNEDKLKKVLCLQKMIRQFYLHGDEGQFENKIITRKQIQTILSMLHETKEKND